MATSDAHIATSSSEEGLDFACSLLSGALDRFAQDRSERSSEVLHELAMYIQLRYVGELLLALEYLAALGKKCDPAHYRAEQFWPQLWWVAASIGVRGDDLARLELLKEWAPSDAI